MAHLVSLQLDLFPRGALALVPRRGLQLDLFTHGALALDTRASRRYFTMDDRERDGRTGGQWLRATKAYLAFGAGDAWRRLSDPEQRNSPERAWYLGGIRTMNGIPVRVREKSKIQIVVKPPQRAALPKKQDSAVAKLTATKSRGWIVAELLRVDPTLNDKKLLLRLSHIKLAGMLLDARSRQRVSSGARPARKKQVRGISPELPKNRSTPLPRAALRRSA